MSIIVTLVEFKGRPANNSRPQEYAGSFTIGRAADNDFVLDDPDKFSSRYHARVVSQGGEFLLIDSSTAGTFVNSDITLNNGDRFKLQTGDLIEIGDSRIKVEINEIDTTYQDMTSPQTIRVDVTETPMRPPAPQPAEEAMFDIDDFFSGGGSEPAQEPSGQGQISQSLDGAYYPPEVAPQPDEFGDIDDIFSSFGNESEAPIPDNIPPQPQAITPQNQPRGVIQNNVRASSSDQENSQDTIALRAFLQELGVDPSQLIGQNKVEIMRVAGVVMRTLTEGMMGVLSARDSVKSQFDMDRTQVKQSKNNPLKFSNSPQEAMAKMLTQEIGYMDPVSSANEAVNDAKAHQVAMISGLNSSISAAIAAFDPKTLEKEFNVGFSLSKNAKYWDLYIERFNKIAKSAQDDSNNIFTEQFRENYQKQIRKISR